MITDISINFLDNDNDKIIRTIKYKNTELECYTSESEKNVSLFIHYNTIHEGNKVIFHNHAGGEMSDIININTGESYTSIKGDGIPDLVTYNKKEDTLYIIESKKSNNTKNIEKQIEKQKYWVKKNIIKKQSISPKIKHCIAIYGGLKFNENKINNISIHTHMLKNKEIKKYL